MSNTTTISDPAPSTPKTIRVLEGEILYKQKSFSSSPTSCCPATCGCMDSEEQCLVLPTVNGELGTSQSELPREDCDLWKRFDYNCKLDSSGKVMLCGEAPGRARWQAMRGDVDCLVLPEIEK
mmetsp:Transcript_24387/g.54949  ORF Transcript_24387/g.54949 Transcript_24387/m.54949 type:complete len:123 (-) Transcript_24387:324-692(-)